MGMLGTTVYEEQQTARQKTTKAVHMSFELKTTDKARQKTTKAVHTSFELKTRQQ
jgi:hypothetical protein